MSGPTREGMLKYMEEASRIVASWPEWKREVLRPSELLGGIPEGKYVAIFSIPSPKGKLLHRLAMIQYMADNTTDYFNHEQVKYLLDQILMMRDALEFYADHESWPIPNDDSGKGIPAAEDNGQIARKALGV